ncbi:MAG: hypothetical protein ACI88Z_002004 [Sphingobacteriales bacterium]|jgi:hypothetical protein
MGKLTNTWITSILFLLSNISIINAQITNPGDPNDEAPYYTYEQHIDWSLSDQRIYLPSDSRVKFTWDKVDGAGRYQFMRTFDPRHTDNYIIPVEATYPGTSVQFDIACYNVSSGVGKDGDLFLTAQERIVPNWPFPAYWSPINTTSISVKILTGNPQPADKLFQVCNENGSIEEICVDPEVYMGLDLMTNEKIYLKEWRVVSWYKSELGAITADSKELLKDNAYCYTPTEDEFTTAPGGLKVGVFYVRFDAGDCAGVATIAKYVIVKMPDLEKFGLPDDIYLVDDDPASSAGLPLCAVPNVTYFPMPKTVANVNSIGLNNLKWKHVLPNGVKNDNFISNFDQDDQKACVSDIKPLKMRTYEVTGTISGAYNIPNLASGSFSCDISKLVNVHVKISTSEDPQVCEYVNGCEGQTKEIDGDPDVGPTGIRDYEWSNQNMIDPSEWNSHIMNFDFSQLPFNNPTLFVLYKKFRDVGEFDYDPFSPQNYCVYLTKNCVPIDNGGGNNKTGVFENSKLKISVNSTTNFSGQIEINANKYPAQEMNYSLFTITGQLVVSNTLEFNGTESKVNISNLSSGTYVLSIINPNSSKIENFKILKQ